MRRATTVIIGAGQCGLAMSRELTGRGVDHVIVERGRIGESWRSGRWDSLRLLTPNWMSALPGQDMPGDDPDGFMHTRELVSRFDLLARTIGAPVMENTRVVSVAAAGEGYRVQTDQGAIACGNVVIASGACAVPKVPGFASQLPASVAQFSPLTYKRPSDLPDGGVLVVGASASGLQIARELQMSGRQLLLAVGNHLRMPRRYRDADILVWMHLLRLFDEPFTKADDIERVRRTPSLPLIGDPSNRTLDLNALQDIGVEVTGRLAGIDAGRALFSGSLANMCAAADLKMNRMLERIDAWVSGKGFGPFVAPAERFAPTRVADEPRLSSRLEADGIRSVIWATGFNPDHSWVHLPVFDRKGRIRHHGGVAGNGLYVMGLPYLRTRRSVHIDGAGRDARALARHLVRGLDNRLAA
ncbi:MAG: NAD(P)-binding domain-containing protein [Tepidamorphaceae bacterium]